MVIKLLIKGKVQGVGFRRSVLAFVQKQGPSSLLGMVCNLPDGQVQVVASGTVLELSLLEQFCYQGPPLSRVDQVIKCELAELPIEIKKEGHFYIG